MIAHLQNIKAGSSLVTKGFYFLVMILLFFTSCTIKYKLPAKHAALIPYTGNEILVFASDKGGRDTIFLEGKWHYFSRPSRLINFLFIKRYENITIQSRRTDPVSWYGKYRYLDNQLLISVSAGKKKTGWIELDISGKDAWFYGDSWMPINKFDSLPTISLVFPNQVINDVVMLEDKKREYYYRSNHVERIYWSKKYGLLRYDKKDGEIWTLQTNIFL